MNKASQTITLFTALRRANLGGALVAMITAGILLGVLMFFSLHAQVNANLDMVARSIAYSVEASLMFKDKVTAQEILEQIAQREKLNQAWVIDQENNVLARVERNLETRGLNDMIGQLVFPLPTEVPVMSNQRLLGHVAIRSDGSEFGMFFLKASITLVISLLVTGCASLVFTRKAERDIVGQLDILAKNTLMRHTPRDQEPQLGIAEFQQINTQFLSLLTELEAKNAELIAYQTDLEDINASLAYQANHDELTNLGNRAYFNSCLDVALAYAKVHNGQLAILYLDLDCFKPINDQYGHAVGDMYLVRTAQSIQHAVRRSDVVARLGGDEFAVLLAPFDSPMVARRVAEKILATPVFSILDQGLELMLSLEISIGIAIYPDAGQDAEALLKAADEAMYSAKKKGGGCYIIAPSQPNIPKKD